MLILDGSCARFLNLALAGKRARPLSLALRGLTPNLEHASLPYANAIGIRFKVILAFAVLLCCTIGLGVFALQRLDGVNRAAADIRDNALPATRVLGELAYHTMRFRQLEATYALAPDAAAKAQEVASMHAVGARAAKSLEAFDPLVAPGEGRRLAEQMMQLWPAYVAQDGKFLAADAVAAVDLYRGEMRTGFNKFQDALQAEIALNMSQATQAGDHGTALGGSAHTWIAIVLGLTALLCGFIGWSMIRDISTPIGAITRVMRRLAEHDLNVQVYGTGRGDEIGSMANAVEVFKANMIEADRSRAEQELRKQRAADERRGAMLELATRFEVTVGSIVIGVTAEATQFQATAQSMTSTAEETSHRASTVAAASEQATHNVNTVAASTEELSASVKEILQLVTESTHLTSETAKEAKDANTGIQALSSAMDRIGQVVGLINGIAGQTNLLALNATIEAARAGDAGKGFAVVASEVKALANQTAKATEEISTQIAAIQAATKGSVNAIQGVVTRLARVSETATAIASAVEEQGAATAEIARNVAEAAAGTEEVTSNIAGVNTAAKQTGAAARRMLASATSLSVDSTTLKTHVDAFLAEVRAA
jgi:methyl-accepting chemotaxis protein